MFYLWDYIPKNKFSFHIQNTGLKNRRNTRLILLSVFSTKKKDKNINYNSKHTKIFKIFMGKLIGDSNNFIRKVFYDLFIA